MGPTGVGKSAVAARAAAELGGEIVCADSRQLYRGIDVGSAQPSAEERRLAPHHLHAILDAGEAISAGRYRDMAGAAIAGIHGRKRIPVLVGGTGLYVRAVLNEWTLAPPATGETVRKIDARAEKDGRLALWRELAAADPAAAGRINRNDRYRIVRALAVMADTGKTITEQQGKGQSPYAPVVRIALNRERESLYARINARCARMLAEGMVDEGRALLAARAATAPVLRAIGYGAVCGMLEGRLTREEALAAMQRDSRRYAKRQMTWLRFQRGFTWIDAGDLDRAAGEAVALIRSSLVECLGGEGGALPIRTREAEGRGDPKAKGA